MAAELKTQCVCLMDAHFPEYAGIFSDMFGAGSRAVLSKSPLPFELARRRADSLARDIAGRPGAAESRPATPQGSRPRPGRRSA